MKDIKIRKKDGTLLTDMKAEMQAGGSIAIILDTTIEIEDGDVLITKKPSGRNRGQIVEKSYIDEVGGTFNYLDEDDSSEKAWVLFLQN